MALPPELRREDTVSSGPRGPSEEFWGMGTVRASAQLLRRLRKDARGFKVSLGSLQNLSQNKL